MPKGEAVRYLGYQVGLELPPEAHLAPLMFMLRKKIVFWNKQHLSLAGRVIIVNYVLLASIWYVASGWLFARSCMKQVKRLIRNFLWSNNSDHNARAKVSWQTIILPTSQGGLGVIDPFTQCKAFISKFIIRSMLPFDNPWQHILKWRTSAYHPSTGGPWQANFRWLFFAGK